MESYDYCPLCGFTHEVGKLHVEDETFDVTFTSKPGPYAQYERRFKGIQAEDHIKAIDIAYRKLSRDFPDRNRDMWTVEVES